VIKPIAATKSLRKAMHLAVSAGHLADHYCRYYQRNHRKFEEKYPEREIEDEWLKLFVEALNRREPKFKLIRDMAIAYKHLYTRTLCSGGDLSARPRRHGTQIGF
jgi:hypothetical protein